MLSKEKTENKNELLRKISKEQYGDEWFIETAILTYKSQQEKMYTFFRNDEEQKLLRKYNFCQRPDSTNMSLQRFTDNGEIEGWMSESLAKRFGLIQIDLNEFIDKFVKTIIKRNLQLETQKQELIEKLEEKIMIIDKLYDEMLTDVGGIKIINVTGLSRKEKEEVTNKRNCLLVQKHCYEEILKILKGDKQ